MSPCTWRIADMSDSSGGTLSWACMCLLGSMTWSCIGFKARRINGRAALLVSFVPIELRMGWAWRGERFGSNRWRGAWQIKTYLCRYRLRGSRQKWVVIVDAHRQYLSLPHLFLLDSGSPVGFLLDSYWIPTKFPKRHFHIFFHFPQLDSYWTPTGFLLDSYWTPTELKKMSQTESNGSDTGFLLDSYWSISITDMSYLTTLINLHSPSIFKKVSHV